MDLPKILIIDDEESIKRTLDLVLYSQFTVFLATTFADGHRIALKYKPDCIILDVLFSNGENGLEMCRKMKGDVRVKNIPIIVYTCKRSNADHVKALNLGAEDYIESPCDRDVFIAHVKKAIDQNRKIRKK